MERTFLSEIKEQPQALKGCVSSLKGKRSQEILAQICGAFKTGEVNKAIFTGMGSSNFVSQSAAVILQREGFPAYAVNSGELLHYQFASIDDKTLLVCVSQSGESYEVVELVKKLSCNAATVAITNEPESYLGKNCKYCILCDAGEEYMTSTKTFIATYLATYWMAMGLLGKDVDWQGLGIMASTLDEFIPGFTEKADEVADFLDNRDFIQVVARGTDMASACQSALMFMEATRTAASAMLAGDFRHGPLEMVGPWFAGIVYAHSKSETYNQMIGLVQDILKFGGKVILITDKECGVRSDKLLQIAIACEDKDLFSIVSICPAQLIVNAFAFRKGITPGNFVHGKKVTAIE